MADCRIPAFLLSFTALAGFSEAQVPAMPDLVVGNAEVQCGMYTNPADPLNQVKDAYLRGRWELVQSLTKTLLGKCKFTSPSEISDLFPGGQPDYRRDYYAIVFGTVGPNDEPVVLKYVVHDPPLDRFSNTLPGIPPTLIDVKPATVSASTAKFLQIFLSVNRGAKLLSSIQAKRTSDPLLDQTPDFLKAAIDPGVIVPLLKGILAPSFGAAAPAPSERPLMATVTLIPVPYRRGELKFSDVIVSPAFVDDKREHNLRTALNEIALEIRADAKYSSVSKGLSIALQSTVDEYLLKRAPSQCLQLNYEAACWTDLSTAVTDEADIYCAKQTDSVGCASEEPSIVLGRYKAAIAEPKLPTIAGTSTFVNTPRQVISFGVVSGFIFRARSSRDRVKLDGGKISADPIGRTLNVVAINFHRPFDPSSPDVTSNERPRAFVGTVVTPNFGLAVGVGFGLLRNLSINGGYAILAIPTLRADDQLNAAPSSAKTPFRVGPAHAAFLGLGYKLK